MSALQHQDGPAKMLIKKKDALLDKRASCPGGPYTFPTHSTSAIDASKGPVVFKWNPACVGDITTLDLSLYAYSLDVPVIKVWQRIPASQGSYSAELLPKWWNASSSISLQLTLSDSSLPSFLSTIPAGPVFDVTYPKEKLVVVTNGQTQAAAPADTGKPDSVYSIASIFGKHGLNAGSIFAAVFFPIVIICAGLFTYIRWARAKQSVKRQRWSRHMDNRMSVISTSWQPNSAQAMDNRKSVAEMANRRETFHSGGTSPGGRDSHAREMSMGFSNAAASFARPQTSVFLATEGQRTSRVSFAHVATPNERVSFAANGSSDGYFSGQGQRGPGQYGGGAAGVGAGGMKMARPSISIYSATEDHSHNGGQGKKESLDMVISPDQVGGPWVLGEDDGPDTHAQSFPAPPVKAKAPAPSFASPFPLGAPVATASPDDMLRNYASGGLTPGASGSGFGARRMTTVTTPGGNNPFRSSMVGEVEEAPGPAPAMPDMGSVGGYFGKH